MRTFKQICDKDKVLNFIFGDSTTVCKPSHSCLVNSWIRALKVREKDLPKLFWTNLHKTKNIFFILSKLMLGGNWKYSSSCRYGGKLPGVKIIKSPSQRQMSVLDRRSSPPSFLSTDNSSQGHVHSDHLASEQSRVNKTGLNLVGGITPWQVTPCLALNSFPWN